MNYYKRHLGDFAKDTAHLSALEIGVYDLLLDRYYATEQPIPDGEAAKFARARSAQERAVVRSVLEEFFQRDGDLWRHGKCDEVIAEAQTKAQANRDNGKHGGRPRNVSRGTNPNSHNAEPKANPEITQSVSFGLTEKTLATNPLATNPEKEPTAAAPPRAEFPEDFEAALACYPKRAGDNPKKAAMRCWGARRAEGHSAEAMRAGVMRYAAWCRATNKIGTETVMQAKRFFGPDKPFLNSWEVGAAPPEKVRAPDCNVPGCKNEGLPSLRGKCEKHYNLSKPLTAAQAAAGIA